MIVRRTPMYLALAAGVAGSLVAFAALRTGGGSWQFVSEPLHVAGQAVGGLAAVGMAMLLLQRRREAYGWKLSLLAMGFLGMGLLDLFFAAPMPGRSFILLHGVAGLMGGSWFALTWWPWSAPERDAAWKRLMPWAVVAGSVLFGIWGLEARETLPVLTGGGRFTTIAAAVNLLAGVFFVAAAVRLLLDFHRLGQPEIYLLACIATLFGLASLTFPSSALWDSTWWFWHLLRVTAYLLALAFVVQANHRMVSGLQVALAERQRVEDALRAANLQRERVEDELRQAQKVEAVGQLAGGIAHDFNNVLTTILATAELIGPEVPEGSQVSQDVRTIHHMALSGAELTRKLLAFGRRQRLELRELDLRSFVRDLSRMAGRVMRENITIESAAEERDTTVRADPGALEQILMNLVTNAGDAMPQGGTLLIRTARASLDQESCDSQGWGEPGEYVVLSVSDTGVGMDQETRRRIFEPFFTTKPVGVGTGLGMAVVYGLVKQHAGHIHVYSEVGRGTTVKVYFPAVAKAAGGPVAPAPAQSVRGGTETLLLVEDDESLRRTAKRVLEKYGYSVLLASDGAEALDLFRAREADIALIVSDVVMPRLGGPQLLAELRRAGKAVKVLFTSGYTARDVEETRALETGVPFLSKPWTIPDLLRRVREVLDA